VKRGLTWWDGRVSLLALDVAVAAGVAVFDLSGPDKGHWSPTTLAMVCLATLALLVRRRFPLVVLVVIAASMVGDVTLLPMTVAVYSVAARHGPSLLTAGAAVVAGGANIALQLRYGSLNVTVVAAMLGLFVLGPVLAGLWMCQRAALLTVLRERAEEAERTRTLLADRAVSAERRRIAREMHDVVGHRVTAIALQAGALSVQAPDERTAQFAETIRSVSAGALDELRGILRVLRDDAQEADAAPWRAEVGLFASIEQLVKDRAETGAQIELDLPDSRPGLADQVERAVYRVVQESLTNAGKHAPGAGVRVGITATASTLTVEITNPLTPVASNVPSSGYGLLGMRERVELAGGELRTGPANGVFRILAEFPLDPSAGERVA
jgi:signal transduction histidine kinase